jgi:four helix bundle protein
MIRLVRPYVVRIKRHDKDLADQMQRCCTSVSLNIAEGAHARGGNRAMNDSTALGSANETLACLQTAEACGFIESIDPAVVDVLRKVMGTLVKCVR